jgi:hypothetical protein
VRDLETPDDDINVIASEAANLIIVRSQGDRAAQISAAMGCLMWITRHHGNRDTDIVRLLGEMYDANPRAHDA